MIIVFFQQYDIIVNMIKYKDYPIFNNLKDSEIEYILSCGIIKNYEKGKILLHQGDEPKDIFIVKNGNLITYRTDNEGAFSAIRLISKGETCMDDVVFMQTNSPVGVQTVKNSEIIQIKSKFIVQYIQENIRFTKNIISILAKRYQETIYQLEGLYIKNVINRTGRYILHTYLLSGLETFYMQFNRNLLASHLGMSIETLSRTIKVIKKMGIDIKGNKVVILDKRALCSFCDDNTFALCKNKKDKCPLNNPVKKSSIIKHHN